MSVNLSPLGGAGAQFFDNSGIPLAGGLIYSYEAGTTTPAATYTSSSGATPHANPIVLDAAGRVTGGEIWITTILLYKFSLKTSANVTIATYDNIGLLGIATSGANSNITSLSGLTTPLSEAQGGTGTTTGYYGFKNRIINGAMVIAQRGTGPITADITAQFPVDRFKCNGSVTSKYTAQQNAGSVTPPTGFINYLGATSSSAYSIPTGEAYSILHGIEGFNVADLGWGTASASAVTLSFRVYSSLTGTFGGICNNATGTRNYTFSYSIPVANTWTTISITIVGDTTGTWLTTNGSGIGITWSLGAGTSLLGTAGAWGVTQYYGATGQVNIVSTNLATFYITGVQLEKGSTATSFDYRPYSTELSLCQRYYEKSASQSVVPGTATSTEPDIWLQGAASAGYHTGNVNLKVTKRTTPTVFYWDTAGAVSKISTYDAASNPTPGVTPTAAPSGAVTDGGFRIAHSATISGIGFTWAAESEL